MVLEGGDLKTDRPVITQPAPVSGFFGIGATMRPPGHWPCAAVGSACGNPMGAAASAGPLRLRRMAGSRSCRQVIGAAGQSGRGQRRGLGHSHRQGLWLRAGPDHHRKRRSFRPRGCRPRRHPCANGGHFVGRHGAQIVRCGPARRAALCAARVKATAAGGRRTRGFVATPSCAWRDRRGE